MPLMCAVAGVPALSAQNSATTFEFQVGALVPANPLFRGRIAHVQRVPGASIGFLLYSYIGAPVGFRVRADFAFNQLEMTDANGTSSDRRYDMSAGIDIVPGFARVSAFGLESHFYAGAGIRLVGQSGDGVTVDQRPDRFSPANEVPLGMAANPVARAGWFIRRHNRPSPLRLDVSYQIGEISGVLQHDMVFRIGIGGD